MDALLGQIVRLSKSIILRPGELGNFPSAQFLAGKRTTTNHFSGIGLTWWYCGDTFPALDSVSAMIVQYSHEFIDCDIDTVRNVLTRTLQELCIDETLFNVDAVMFGDQRNLFECVAVPAPEYAKSILEAVKVNLSSEIAQRCSIYAVPRLVTPSFRILDQHLRIISHTDSSAWQELESEGYLFDGWRPQSPSFRGKRDSVFAPPLDHRCLILAESIGTQAGSKFGSILKFRILLGVLFAIASQSRKYSFSKAAASPLTFFIQFPHQSDRNPKASRSDSDPLIPYYAADISFGVAEVDTARGWYQTLVACDQGERKRAEKGAHFLNLAMNATGVEEFVNFFIVLDAIFGQRGAVEDSILSGVAKVVTENALIEKTKWLFELRSELVHGGSRFVEEWPKYSRYCTHFGTKPLQDIQHIAEVSVLNAPKIILRERDEL